MSLVKQLVACGCSFTQGHHLAKQGITWPDYVAKKKNWKLHNIACGGMGNEWIAQQTIGFLESNPEIKADAVVIIGWSDSGRQLTSFNSEPENKDEYTLPVTISPSDFGRANWASWPNTDFHNFFKEHHKILEPFFSNISYCFMKTYQSMFFLKTYLEANNIQYIFFDALASNRIKKITRIQEAGWRSLIEILDSYDDTIVVEESIFNTMDQNYFVLNENIINSIYNEKFITFDGQSMLPRMRRDYEYFTEGNSGHPNAFACDLFSDMIISEYNKLY